MSQWCQSSRLNLLVSRYIATSIEFSSILKRLRLVLYLKLLTDWAFKVSFDIRSVRIYCPDRFQMSFRAKSVCDRVHWVNNCDVKKDFQSLTISSHKTTNSSKWVLLLIQCHLTHLLQIFWTKLGSIRCKYDVRNKLEGCSGQLTFFSNEKAGGFIRD